LNKEVLKQELGAVLSIPPVIHSVPAVPLIISPAALPILAPPMLPLLLLLPLLL
jgi:hypothetical protein